MTVCIAATCDNGDRIVSATDGLLSLGDVTGEAVPGKMLWYRDWQFMYAGTPANFSMVSEEIESVGMDDPEALSRRRVQETVRQAYRKVYSRLASCDSLNPFDMTLEEFKDTGVSVFGESFHEETLRRISQKASLIDDQILVTGWGASPHSVMIYEVGPSGEWLHSAAGWATIGSGAQMAQTMLLLLGQARHRTLAETLFNVACAKFSSEKSTGLDVGKMTTMYVSRKRTGEDDPKALCGQFVSFADIDKLRGLWEAHLKPRIPAEARIEITRMAARVNNGKISLHDMVEHFRATQQLLNEESGFFSPADSGDPQSTMGAPSRSQPSPERPAGSDES